MVGKRHLDNAEGRLDDDRFQRMAGGLAREATGLKAMPAELSEASPAQDVEENYRRFFTLARAYTQVRELTREDRLAVMFVMGVGHGGMCGRRRISLSRVGTGRQRQTASASAEILS